MKRAEEQDARAPSVRLGTTQRGQFVLYTALMLGLLLVIATVSPPSPPARLSTVMFLTLTCGAVAGLWILGAWGLGLWVLRRAAPEIDRGSSAPAGLALGVGLMLLLAHAMGMLGAFSSTAAGLAASWAPVVLGLCLGLRRCLDVVAGAKSAEPRSFFSGATLGLLAPLIGAVLMFAACAVAPGLIWRSEANQFDTLSYHLQLPREWLAAGRLWPAEHNAYSWLPSYVEAAYLQLAAMVTRPGHDPTLDGLTEAALHAPQYLHALMALAAAWVCVSTIEPRASAAGSIPSGHSLAWGVVLLTPWVLVVGSCAYNEMAVCLLLAGALMVASRCEVSPTARGALAGLMVGAACGAKPTAFFMAGFPVGVMLLANTPRRSWPVMLGAAMAAGLAALAPWLARNGITCGNPLFPYATGFFGDGPWTSHELDRWHAGHHSRADFGERMGLLAGERGVLHAQWSITPLIITVASVVSMLSPKSRRAAWPLVVGLSLQGLAWVVLGHQQSRFLLPMIVPGAMIVGLALARARDPWTACAVLIVQGVMLAQAASLWWAEHHRGPAMGLIAGVEAITARSWRGGLSALSPHRRAEILAEVGPIAYANLVLTQPIPPGSSPVLLYLLGDSTPLYFLIPTLYHTTWSASPLGRALRETGGDLEAAARRLASPSPDGLGITHILINYDELARLHGDGWYDPDATIEAAQELQNRFGHIIRAWPGPGGRGGSVLFALSISGNPVESNGASALEP